MMGMTWGDLGTIMLLYSLVVAVMLIPWICLLLHNAVRCLKDGGRR
jgi:hypothetical protein